MNDNVVKLNKRKFTGGEKATIIVAAVLTFALLVTIAVSATFAVFTNRIEKGASSGEATSLSEACKKIYFLMPKELDGEVSYSSSDVRPVKYYLVVNENFDEESGDIVQFFNFYYVDDYDNTVEMNEDGKFESGVNEDRFQVLTGFALTTVKNLSTLRTTVVYIRIAVIAAIIVDLIVLWYIEFSRAEDEKKRAINKQKHQHGK